MDEMPKRIFITGTDTDVGKTFISALLVKKWKMAYWKPFQTGLNCDPGDTKTVTGLIGAELKTSSPAVELQLPLSPWRATVLESKSLIDLNTINIPNEIQDLPLIIEGAGGVQVPINDKQITTDLIKQFDVPVIVVARSELGTLNHTLLTIEHLQNRKVKVLGVILNGDINNDNADTLKAYGVNIICQIPKSKSLQEVEHLVPNLKDVYIYN
ncbi:hypothetical protein BN7_6325 [Wickerhamomyces ciferrii]|uniref:Dethiobiotin synthase n=1 Tax=Wickerhamomyces ciferrii (strain ATCC 14091 / BCRC 22168 / CBS 111 / JCM 3599 / NBRC 0793 / NRRL Y-1031 F-60-10) TaxID=1206466 RepID=K0L011_WICCF|nr:uncharacterized protein BN7_6325 [Wickerhamomyces ciferrii]CCH46728.1 hypothetical protein BN7_6325 [Wickerhamomyces ciferrii]